jgi:hypothetical protein
MNHKCYLCVKADAQIIERPEGYDGNNVVCPLCSQYRISRNTLYKIINGHRVPDSLLKKVRDHFDKIGEPYVVSTVDWDIG